MVGRFDLEKLAKLLGFLLPCRLGTEVYRLELSASETLQMAQACHLSSQAD